jgi:hypothetical protein
VAYADLCSGGLGKSFTDNLSFGNQPIIKVVSVLTATLLIYLNKRVSG